jgi:hypothetical protein
MWWVERLHVAASAAIAAPVVPVAIDGLPAADA